MIKFVAEETRLREKKSQKKFIFTFQCQQRDILPLCLLLAYKDLTVVICITLLKLHSDCFNIISTSFENRIKKKTKNKKHASGISAVSVFSCEDDLLFATFCQPTHGSCRSLRPLVSHSASSSNPLHPRSHGNNHSSQLPKQHGRPRD